MKRALIYLSIALVLLYIVRAIEYAGIRRATGGEFAKLRTMFLEENNFDLVVIGSSRAECQYYTPIIDSATGLHCYNLGVPGSKMPMIAVVLDAYLERSAAPEYVVLNLDIHSLGDESDVIHHFPRYFAFLGNDKLCDGLQELDNRFYCFKWLPFYSLPYSSVRYMSNSVHGWMGTPTQYDAGYVQGFAPCLKEKELGDLDTMTMLVSDASVPKEIIDGIIRIKNICDAHNSKLIISVSPLFHRQEEAATGYGKCLQEFQTYAKTNHIPFIDLGHDSIRFEKQMYLDPGHLNTQGAQIYTRRFCSVLGQYLHK